MKGLHSIGELDPERRFIMHFPEELSIKSFGSGYGGNALLGKKCHALRIASWQARKEGWLAEHMLIVGIENPQGRNALRRRRVPERLRQDQPRDADPAGRLSRSDGWKVWTVGDDICWMRPGADGRLYAINPEAGYFGVAPGTSDKTNPNALAMLDKDAIFTNVGRDRRQPAVVGRPAEGTPATDWQGRAYDAGERSGRAPQFALHRVARSSARATPRAPRIAQGVPLSAIVFGGRRESLVPLVFEARDWTHGVLVGASMASETTAAATGAVGVVRRDSMAMKPFAGYNFGDYFAHWLSFGDQRSRSCRRSSTSTGSARTPTASSCGPASATTCACSSGCSSGSRAAPSAVETPIGLLPRAADLNTEGLDLDAGDARRAAARRPEGWRDELAAIGEYLDEFGERTPSPPCSSGAASHRLPARPVATDTASGRRHRTQAFYCHHFALPLPEGHSFPMAKYSLSARSGCRPMRPPGSIAAARAAPRRPTPTCCACTARTTSSA